MDDQLKQLQDRLKLAQNVLVTVSKDPSVDQLAASIGLTLALNKMGKHATVVYSGATPSTIQFLKPAEIIEENTDSLRDFIIALDKTKADKLRYKVEDEFVRIFITPYKSSISESDLEFSQGDFNVDVVLALGVQSQDQLDEAIRAHGRIFHDATVATIDLETPSELGSINWANPKASSLCEMSANLIGLLDNKAVDAQIATALLTGIVATTDRFKNDKTSPNTMSISAVMMSAGANPQLIADELEKPESLLEPGDVKSDSPDPSSAGMLEVQHGDETDDSDQEPIEEVLDIGALAEMADKKAVDSEDKEEFDNEDSPEESESHEIEVDEHGQIKNVFSDSKDSDNGDATKDELTLPALNNDSSPDTEGKTLEEIERDVNSPHLTMKPADGAADNPLDPSPNPLPEIDGAKPAEHVDNLTPLPENPPLAPMASGTTEQPTPMPPNVPPMPPFSPPPAPQPNASAPPMPPMPPMPTSPSPEPPMPVPPPAPVQPGDHLNDARDAVNAAFAATDSSPALDRNQGPPFPQPGQPPMAAPTAAPPSSMPMMGQGFQSPPTQMPSLGAPPPVPPPMPGMGQPAPLGPPPPPVAPPMVPPVLPQ